MLGTRVLLLAVRGVASLGAPNSREALSVQSSEKPVLLPGGDAARWPRIGSPHPMLESCTCKDQHHRSHMFCLVLNQDPCSGHIH